MLKVVFTYFAAFGAMESHYQIKFRSPYGYKETENFNQRKMQKNEGPVVERKCSKCGNDIMSYATLQLRSADEGQTVFYTCTKCGLVLDLIQYSNFLLPS